MTTGCSQHSGSAPCTVVAAVDQPGLSASPPVELVDVAGQTHRPFDDPQTRAVALVFLLPDCPIANSYAPELNRLMAGTKVVLEAVHDNSADNFRNPSLPPARVSWGEETTNEMTVAFLQTVLANEADVSQLGKLRQRVLGFIPAAKALPPAK